MATTGREGRSKKRPNWRAEHAARSILKNSGPVYEDVPVLNVRGCEDHDHKNRAEALKCLAERSKR